MIAHIHPTLSPNMEGRRQGKSTFKVQSQWGLNQRPAFIFPTLSSPVVEERGDVVQRPLYSLQEEVQCGTNSDPTLSSTLGGQGVNQHPLRVSGSSEMRHTLRSQAQD